MAGLYTSDDICRTLGIEPGQFCVLVESAVVPIAAVYQECLYFDLQAVARAMANRAELSVVKAPHLIEASVN